MMMNLRGDDDPHDDHDSYGDYENLHNYNDRGINGGGNNRNFSPNNASSAQPNSFPSSMWNIPNLTDNYHGGKHGVRELTILNVSEAGFTDASQAPDIVHIHYKIVMSWIYKYGVQGPNQKRLSALIY